MTIWGWILTLFCIFDLFSTVILLEKGIIAERNPILNWALTFGMEYMVGIKILLNWGSILTLETAIYKKWLRLRTYRLVVISFLVVYIILVCVNF